MLCVCHVKNTEGIYFVKCGVFFENITIDSFLYTSSIMEALALNENGSK